MRKCCEETGSYFIAKILAGRSRRHCSDSRGDILQDLGFTWFHWVTPFAQLIVPIWGQAGLE